MAMKKKKNGFYKVRDADLDIRGIIDKYYDAVKANALYVTRSEDAASDVTQEVFKTLVEKWEKIDRNYAGVWLFGVTRRKLLEFFHKSARADGILPLEDAEIVDNKALSSDDVYFDLTDEQLDAAKERVLSVLTDDERALYEAYFVERKTYGDICALYSLSYSAATSRVKRIRRKLERSVKENGPDALIVLLSVSGAAMAYFSNMIFNGR